MPTYPQLGKGKHRVYLEEVLARLNRLEQVIHSHDEMIRKIPNNPPVTKEEWERLGFHLSGDMIALLKASGHIREQVDLILDTRWDNPRELEEMDYDV